MAKKLTVTEERQALIDAAVASLGEAKDKLQELFDDLDEKRANMEENFSGTERYERFEAACSGLEEAIGEIETAQDTAQVELP